jgi:hypothetical protein
LSCGSAVIYKLFSFIHTVSREKYSVAQNGGDQLTKLRKSLAEKTGNASPENEPPP